MRKCDPLIHHEALDARAPGSTITIDAEDLLLRLRKRNTWMSRNRQRAATWVCYRNFVAHSRERCEQGPAYAMASTTRSGPWPSAMDEQCPMLPTWSRWRHATTDLFPQPFILQMLCLSRRQALSPLLSGSRGRATGLAAASQSH